MGKLPHAPSPAKLRRTVPAEVRVVRRGALLWRICFSAGRHPVQWNDFRYFGPLDRRFDHHTEPRRTQKRGMLYAAASCITPFAEVFQDARLIDTQRKAPCLAAFQLMRDVQLLDLRGPWPTRAGASANIHSGSRKRAREWSRAIYAAYPDLDGLWYCSAMDANEPALALYERAASALPEAPAFHRALADPALAALVRQAAARFGYGLG